MNDLSIFTINTMTEDKYIELSSEQKLSNEELNIVNNCHNDMTTIPTYDLIKHQLEKLKQLNYTSTIEELMLTLNSVLSTFGSR